MLRRSASPDEEMSQVRFGRKPGIIVVLAAVMMIVMMAMLAFSIDVGYMYTMQSQLQRSVDAATLAGAGSLIDGEAASTDAIHEYLVRNPVGTQWKEYDNQPVSESVQHFLTNYSQGLDVSYGDWDDSTKQIVPSNRPASTVKVSMRYDNMPFFFGHLLGRESFSIRAESAAAYQPRDIMVVLDLSGSMNDDSEFNAFNTLGAAHVTANQYQMYEELGSPIYGNLEFTPQWATAKGPAPTRDSHAQVSVEYQYNKIVVNSTKSYNRVRVRRADNNIVTYYPSSGEATLSPGSQVREVWVYSGKNADGSDQIHYFNFTQRSTFEAALGLDTVNYPYGGNWNSYLDYCMSGSNQNNSKGFRYKFGYQNLIVFWLDQRSLNSQMPDMWKASAQPITALKSSVTMFVNFIQQADSDDQMGLAVYNGPDGEGVLESILADDYGFIIAQANQRQAGHYHNYTNIAGGMTVAREELDVRARAGAYKMIVLMTDGQANWNNGGVNSSAARNAVLEEAYLAADRGYVIVTISMGAGADKNLMQQVADITKGSHFNIPGGKTGEEYAEELTEVFQQIAGYRPLRLVQ
ncbi:pilus assembly protein TadG-related protein [Bremerella cremea]|uniref:pilus assembly protein TadG-related protein n=1 Tax=Bremerella cremea TaxID=1031537 RepID=UPI0031EF5FF0